MCNPQFQLFTCNSLQRLSRKTNSVQECQYRKKPKSCVGLDEAYTNHLKIHRIFKMHFVCILYAFCMHFICVYMPSLKMHASLIKVHVFLPKMHAFFKSAYKTHMKCIQNAYKMHTKCLQKSI